MSILTSFIIGVLPLIVYYCYGIYRKNKLLEKIPGPLPIPFLFTKVPKDIYDAYEIFDGLFKKYGKTFKMYVGNNLQILTMDHNVIDSLLKSNVHTYKSDLYQFAGLWLKDGIVVSGGKKWKSRRKLLSPAFYFTTIKDFFPIFMEQTDVLIEKLGKEADKGAVIQAFEFSSKFALDIVSETSFGTKLNIQKGERKEFTQAAGDFIGLVVIKNFSVWKRFPLLFKYFAPDSYELEQKSLNILFTTSMNIIKGRREFYAKHSNGKLNINSEDNKENSTGILVDTLLQHPELTDDDILEEVNNFLFAGHDTIATTLAFAFLELSRRSDIQERIYEEINSHIHNDINQLSREALLEMNYLDMVIKEILRLRSPAPFIERQLKEDAILGDKFFPKGTNITIFLHWLQLDSDLYPNPHKFDPERFNPENQAKRTPSAFVPFSAGPRSCIGQKYALLEIKTALARIILEFKIHPVKDFKCTLGLGGLLRSKDGIPVTLERRRK